MEHDVRIQLEVRPELLAAYNDKYGKNYQIPPEESYALSSTETTIPRSCHDHNSADRKDCRSDASCNRNHSF